MTDENILKELRSIEIDIIVLHERISSLVKKASMPASPTKKGLKKQSDEELKKYLLDRRKKNLAIAERTRQRRNKPPDSNT